MQQTQSLDDIELAQVLFGDFQAQAGLVVVQLDVAIDRSWLALEHVVKEFVTDLDIEHREKLGHRRCSGRHGQVVVVHLPGMGDHRHRPGFGHGVDLARRGNPTHAVGVVLDHVLSLIHI